MNIRYRLVESYYRQAHFDFWSDYRNPFYSVTFDLDITRVKAFSEERGHSVNVNLCYLMTRAMRSIEDFRYRLVEGKVALFEELHPAVTLPAPGGLFSFADFEYHGDLETFHAKARGLVEAARRSVRLENPSHPNRVFFTALPKVPFTSFTHATNETTSAEPQVAFGRFTKRQGRLYVPAGVQVNHVFIDGKALGELVERTQSCYDEPERTV